MLHIIIGGAGCGKSTRMMERIHKQATAGESILVIVPEQFSYEFDRKLYHMLGAAQFNRLETHSFKSLAREIFLRYGSATDGKQRADKLTQTALLYQAVLCVAEKEKKLRVLEKQCRQPAFVQELSEMISRFRTEGVAPEQIYEKSATLNGKLQEKILDIFEIYQRYDRLLTEHRLKDTETDLSEAAAIANCKDAFLGSVLFLDEFDVFTEDEYEMLDVLLASCRDVVIALRTDDSEPMPFSLFQTVQDTMLRLKRMASKWHIAVSVEHCETPYRFQFEELRRLSRHAFRNTEPYSGETPHLHIVEARTPNEEADYVCTTIRRLLAADSTLRCRDIAVLSNQMSEYQSILQTAMERYALRYHMDSKESMRYTPLLVYLRTLLGILQSRKPDTELLLRLGKTRLTTCTDKEIAELENYCYIWQIDGKTWNEPFTGGTCAEVEETRKKLLFPLQALQYNMRGTHTGMDFCVMLFDFLEQEDMENRMNLQCNQASLEERMQQKADWTYAWNSFVDILEHMAALYADVELELPQFCAILTALTDTVQRAVPPRTLDAILISQGTSARLNAPKIVLLMGVCEGSFPSIPGGNAVFSERDCKTLEDIRLSVSKPREGQMADARLSAYVLLSSASDSLYLTYPCTNTSQEKCYPASVIAQIRRMFPDSKTLRQTCSTLGTSYYSTTLHAAYYQYVQDYMERSSDTAAVGQLLRESPYALRLQRLSQLAQKHEENDVLFSVSDPALMQRYLGNSIRLSASSLERYEKCPFQYYCNDVLRLYQRQKIQMAGANTGSMVHLCLERLLKKYSKEQFLTLSEKQLKQEIQTCADEYRLQNMGGDFSKSGREQTAYRRAVSAVLPVVRHLQEEFRQSAFAPYCMELEISPHNPDFPPILLHTKQGQTVQLIGKVDRVDICQDGNQQWVRVVDYKTGDKIFSLGHLLYGLDMQMLIYLFSILSPHAALSGAKAAGVLYLPSGKVKSDWKREDAKSPQEKQNNAYRMNGVLLRDAHLLQLMERDGKGIYVPGELDANGSFKTEKGTFLTAKQMESLRCYILRRLTEMAEHVYHGDIDALPLKLSEKENPCRFCAFDGICGNIEFGRQQALYGGSKASEKQMYEILEQIAEEGKSK